MSRWIGLFLIVSVGDCHQPAPAIAAELDRDRVMQFLDDAGAIRQVTTISDWHRRRDSIIAAMHSVMGEFPPGTRSGAKRSVPTVEVIEEVDCGSYVRRMILYRTQPDCETPAYLCIPKALLEVGSAPAPAILCLHPTDNSIGHDVVVGLGGKPNRQYASELAARGYVTLAPSYPLLANYQPNLESFGWQSGTLKAVWDNIRGIDYLLSLPFVQKDAIAAIGHSLGGHNAVYTAAFDERIQVIVSSCGLDRYRDYYDGDRTKWHAGKGWTSTRYMPKLADYQDRLEAIPFDFPEMIAALAPRHVLIVAPLYDSNFRAASVDLIAESARPVYRLYKTPKRLVIRHPDCEHDFPEPMRKQAYELFDRVFHRD